MGMDEGVSAQLALPPKSEIESYARASFSALDTSVADLDPRNVRHASEEWEDE
jgi:hypothetical protein